jgi:hypothetical protein
MGAVETANLGGAISYCADKTRGLYETDANPKERAGNQGSTVKLD